MDGILAGIPIFLDEEDAAFRATLHEQGFEIVEIPMDGNCFYSAIAESILGSMHFQQDVRSAIQLYILNHINDFREFYEDMGVFDFPEQVLRITINREWADQASISAASHLYETNIVILQPSGIPIHHPNDQRYSETIYLSYHHAAHYNLLRINDGVTMGVKQPEEPVENANNANNASLPLDVFPMEVWEHILEQHDSVVDRKITQLALPELSGSFKYRSPKWLMLKVLPILSKFLSISDLLSMRRVCRLWDEALHGLVEHHPYYQPYNEDQHNGLPVVTTDVNRADPVFKLATRCPIITFRDTHCIDEFLKFSDVTNFGRGPIFGRTLMIDPVPLFSDPLNNVKSMRLFENLITKLLSRFGTEIRHLILTSHAELETAIEFFHRMYLILCKTPKLRSLSLILENQPDTRSMPLGLIRRGLPRLAFLSFLKYMQATERHPKDIFDSLISYMNWDGTQVRKLVVSALPQHSFNFRICFARLSELEVGRWKSSLSQSFHLTESLLQKLVDKDNSDIIDYRQKIELQNLRVLHTCSNGVHDDWIFHLPNVHTLRFRDSAEINYNLLFRFPLLFRIEIIQNPNAETRRIDNPSGDDYDLTQEIREFVYNIDLIEHSRVWVWLPRLFWIWIGIQGENIDDITWLKFSRE